MDANATGVLPMVSGLSERAFEKACDILSTTVLSESWEDFCCADNTPSRIDFMFDSVMGASWVEHAIAGA